MDYVVVHELTQLKKQNHTKRFWQMVGGYKGKVECFKPRIFNIC